MEHVEMTETDRKLLEKLPLGLALIEPNGTIGWCNDQLSGLLGTTPAALLDRRWQDLDDPARRLLGGETRVLHVPASRRWVSAALQDADGGRLFAVLTDVTAEEQLAEENARLRQQVEDLKLTDELTGLPNKRAISQALELHVSRSRRYNNPLSTVLVYVDLQPLAGVQPLSTDSVVLSVSRYLRDRLRWVDQIARWEDNVFLLVLPETTEDDARGLLDKIVGEQSSMVLPEACGDDRPGLGFGLACWQKGDDMRTLLRRALRDLQEADGA